MGEPFYIFREPVIILLLVLDGDRSPLIEYALVYQLFLIHVSGLGQQVVRQL
jgi:hypothetical protein